MAELLQFSILGQNPKLRYRKFNGLQTHKLSKKQICDIYGPADDVIYGPADDVKEPLSTTWIGADAVIYPAC